MQILFYVRVRPFALVCVCVRLQRFERTDRVARVPVPLVLIVVVVGRRRAGGAGAPKVDVVRQHSGVLNVAQIPELFA